MTMRKTAPLAICIVEIFRAVLLFWTLLLSLLADPTILVPADLRLLAAVLASAQLLPALAWFAVWRGESPSLLAWVAFPAHALGLAALFVRYAVILLGGGPALDLQPGTTRVMSWAVLSVLVLDALLLWISLRMARLLSEGGGTPADPAGEGA